MKQRLRLLAPRARNAVRLVRHFLPRVRRLDPPTVRALWWSAGELRRLRRVLGPEGLEASVRHPPPLPSEAVRGVRFATTVGRATCLERSLILQRWFMDHGQPYEILVGVNPGGGEFTAHAWLDGYDGPQDEYTVLTRKPAA